ncbi:MAG: hypothetical protein AAB731_03610 [Patescibacteria group bacterium]
MPDKPPLSHEGIIHIIMKRLRRGFVIDPYDDNPNYISDPKKKDERNRKRQAMLNAGSERIGDLAKNGRIASRPNPTEEGQIVKEAIHRLSQNICPCGQDGCPSREPSIARQKCDGGDKDKCECDGNGKGNCKNCGSGGKRRKKP